MSQPFNGAPPMPAADADRARSLIAQASRDAADAADRLYALQIALRSTTARLPVEPAEASTLQRRAADLAEALRDIEGRKGWG